MTQHWKGRWTLITGASAGIGKVFAETLAAGGSHLVLTARRMDRLEELASGLRAASGVQVHCVAADLEQPEAPESIFDFTQQHGIPVDFLINNAGFGAYGEFHGIDRARQTAMVRVNCAAVVSLTHLYLQGMVERRRGNVLILSSSAAYQPVPYMSVYAATKAFDLLFAEALAREVERYGIRVCALSPGATATEFDTIAGIPTERTPHVETAEKVVRVGLEALLAGKHSVISGFPNRVGAEVQRLVPRRVVSHFAERMFRPKR